MNTLEDLRAENLALHAELADLRQRYRQINRQHDDACAIAKAATEERAEMYRQLNDHRKTHHA